MLYITKDVKKTQLSFEISDIYRFDKKNKVFKSTKKLALILSEEKTIILEISI